MKRQHTPCILLGILLLLSSFYGFAQQFNYGEVLQKSLFFYEAQQSGQLPDWNRVSWRGDANVNDGQSLGVDLSGGWHDAGDHIKFGLPMAFSVTALNWGYLEYQDAYTATGQDEIFRNNIRWVTDYFIKAHTGPNELVAQISDKGSDHSVWAAAELTEIFTNREVYKITADNPGTELACETAAALASASMVFQDLDPAYSAELLTHAIQLYEFGDQYRGFYTGSVPAGCCYPSGNYVDELVWGALWLYKATGDAQWLQKAEMEYDNMINPSNGLGVDFRWSLVWEDKSYGNFVLLSQLTGEQKYRDDAERHLDFWIDDVSKSPGGQAWLFQWGSLRHSANFALTSFIYCDNLNPTREAEYVALAEQQINYALGDNPRNSSYVIGFGNNPPLNPHHRTNHGSWLGSDRGEPVPSTHTLYGALVGGPGAADDQHEDVTSDFQENEVAVDYNACFQGAVARMVEKYGGTPLANFPIPEVPDRAEFFANTRINGLETTNANVSIDLSNHSAWPAKALFGPSARYFMDISESVAAGYSIDDYQVALGFAEGGGMISGPFSYRGSNTVYYVEVTWSDDVVIAPAGQSHNAKEAQVRITVPNGVPFDLSNDWSAQGLDGTRRPIENIPVYDNGRLIGGKEPFEGPVYTVTASSGTGGAISPSGPQEVQDGGNITFSISPNAGFLIDDVVVNGSSVGAVSSYTFTDVSSDQSISATFTAAPTYTITATAGVGGAISPSGQVAVAQGSNRTFTISPSAGFTVDDVVVNGASVGEVRTYTFSDVQADQSISVSFVTAPTYTITASAGSGGSITPSGSVIVTEGADPLFNITADEGFAIDEVLVDDVSVGAVSSYTFTNVMTDHRIAATFSEVEIGSCGFDTPLNTPLPSVNSSYDYVYVLGTGGPDLSNVSIFTINWDLQNNGLWQLSFNTNNGVPDWWMDLRNSISFTFNGSSPGLTFSGSGIPDLDGDYYVTRVGADFAMVAASGGYTIYYSNDPTPPDCESVAARMAGTYGEQTDNVTGDPLCIVYPNPFNETIHIHLQKVEEVRSLQLTDLSGRTVQVVEGPGLGSSGDIQLDMSHQSKGMYHLLIDRGGVMETMKLQKQ